MLVEKAAPQRIQTVRNKSWEERISMAKEIVANYRGVSNFPFGEKYLGRVVAENLQKFLVRKN